MQGDDPPYLPVGTAVSAKYKGAFCEAKVSKVVRCVKCKITYKMGLGTATVTDEQVRGSLRVGHTVQARHSEKKEFVEATITKIQDCSQYTVVFDDGDITTLRRTALCLKSGRHFNESETLDQLPLTHPEHFGNPVVGGRRGRRSRQLKEDSSEGEVEEEAEPDLDLYSSDIGKVVCVEGNDKKKSRENWFPGLVVVPSAQPTVRINVREEYLVRSFKDGRYYTVPKKEISDFSRDMGARVESAALSEAMEKALKYLDRDELPVHWERATLFDLQLPDSDSDENYTDSSDDEPREEKDHFVAQLYKFMDDRGTPLNKSPMIASRDVDLYRLFRVVQKLGGYNRVTNQGKWRSVTIRLGYPHNHATYNQVKQAYKKHLFSFEEFYRKLGCTMINHPRNAKKHRGRSLIRDRDRATPVNHSPRPEDAPLEDIKCEVVPPPLPAIVKKEPLKIKEEDIKDVKRLKKEVSVERLSSSSSSSSDATVDMEAGPSSKPPLIKEESVVKKKIETVVKAKERRVKAAAGEKVKALVEHFEEANKVEEEKVLQQQTRSKSAIPRLPKEVASPERERREPPGPRLVKPPKKIEEDKSKRGRKRKDTETETKPPNELAAEVTAITAQPVNIGDKLKVYYGPTHESKVTYEAKVLEIDRDSAGTIYLVHYTGWNTRYDEWIKPMRIAENLSLTTKAKRLKLGHTPNKAPKVAAKRGRGTSITSRETLPPRSTTPSSVTSSSSRTKSPATPASSKTTRVTRQGETNRRTRRTSAHTDLSVASSDSDPSESESEELSRTRSGSKSDDQPLLRKKLPLKRKDDEDSEDEVEIKPKRMRKKMKVKLEEKNSTESDDDETSPPKGRDFDLNQIRSELKGFEKAVKLSSETTSAELPENKIAEVLKITTKSELIKTEIEVETTTTDDIYEFKEPEPFEFESRTKTEDKPKKRLVPRLFEELEKSPKKKGSKTPPKTDHPEDKKRLFKRTPKKVPVEEEEEEEEEEEDDDNNDEEETPIKLASTSADPFDKLVESPSFNIGGEKRTPPPAPPEPISVPVPIPIPTPAITKPRVVKALNMDETLRLFGDLLETVGDDSRDRLDLSDTDDTQTESLFTHREPIFLDPSFSKVESAPIFRGFSGDDDKKCSKEQSDEDDSITAAIQRAISNTMTDEDSTEVDLFGQHFVVKSQIKEELIPSSSNSVSIVEDVKEPLTINTTDLIKDVKEKDLKEKPKQISPALQETDSSLLEAISLKTEVLKKEDNREPQIKTGTKIADSILQKFNMIKKNEEIKPVMIAPESEPNQVIDDIKTEPEAEAEAEPPPEPQSQPQSQPLAPEFIPEMKKRTRKVVSREFIEESDTDSDDSEERLVIARSDEDSQTSPSDKLDPKDTDNNSAPPPITTDDSQPDEHNFKLGEIKVEPVVITELVEPKTEIIIKPLEEEPDNNISLLLCKETIPGSPAPVTEASPAPAEPRTKPKSAKSLLLEMPFASAPGSSNSKTMMATPLEIASKVAIKEEVLLPLAVPLETPENESSSVMIDNTPPTTPESTISNLSPRGGGGGDGDRISPSAVDNESCKSTDSGTQKPTPSKVTHYSEEDTILTAEPCLAAPKKLTPPPSTSRAEDISGVAPCRKRRRSCKASDEIPSKRGRRPNVRNLRANSDSDDTSEHSAPGSTPPTISITSHVASLQLDTRRLSSRSPRPSKYNFIIELDPGLDCGQKISLLQQKLTELRKTYINVKTELACIDRRRKKLRRREREAMKAAKQELACA